MSKGTHLYDDNNSNCPNENKYTNANFQNRMEFNDENMPEEHMEAVDEWSNYLHKTSLISSSTEDNIKPPDISVDWSLKILQPAQLITTHLLVIFFQLKSMYIRIFLFGLCRCHCQMMTENAIIQFWCFRSSDFIHNLFYMILWIHLISISSCLSLSISMMVLCFRCMFAEDGRFMRWMVYLVAITGQ